MDKKSDPHICCLYETRFIFKDTNKLKVKRWEKIYHVNSNCRKAGVALLTSDKIDFKTKDAGDKEGHFITIRELIHQEDISINIYTPT